MRFGLAEVTEVYFGPSNGLHEKIAFHTSAKKIRDKIVIAINFVFNSIVKQVSISSGSNVFKLFKAFSTNVQNHTKMTVLGQTNKRTFKPCSLFNYLQLNLISLQCEVKSCET